MDDIGERLEELERELLIKNRTINIMQAYMQIPSHLIVDLCEELAKKELEINELR